MRDDRERLLDIREAIERIERYAARGREDFEKGELIQNWIVRHLQIIGEAARALSPAFKNQHTDVPWSEIIGMRIFSSMITSGSTLGPCGRRLSVISQS